MSATGDLGNDSPFVDPQAADRLMRWVGVAMFLLGSVTLLATLPLPDPNTSDHPAIRVIAALLGLGAVFVWRLRPGRRWVARATVVYGILLVSALMAVTRPIEATPFFYLWPMVFSAYFCTRREVAADLALMWATLGVALFVFSDDPMKPVLFIGVGISVSLTTLVVKLLRRARLGGDPPAGHGGRHRLPDGPAQPARVRPASSAASSTARSAAGFRWRWRCSTSTTSSRSTTATGTPSATRCCATSPRCCSASCAAATRSPASAARSSRWCCSASSSTTRWPSPRASGASCRPAAAGRACLLSASAGVAALSEADPGPAALLLVADRALYAAKEAGRRCVAVWHDGQTRVEARMDGEPALAADVA